MSLHDDRSTVGLVGKLVAVLIGLGLLKFFHRMYQVRMLLRRAARDHGVPMIPHSFLFGHILVIAKITMKRKLPIDLHGHWTFHTLKEEYPEIAKCGIIYFDPWPFGFPMLAVLHPGMIAQFSISPSLPKFFQQREVEFRAFSGGVDLVTSEGPVWKEQRVIYNPGFSAQNIMSMAPWFLEEVIVFRDKMLQAAESGKVIKLEHLTMALTFDVIARATFNIRTRSQEGAAPPWLDTLRAQIETLYFNLEPKKALNPLLPLKNWNYNRILKKAIEPHIQEAYDNYSNSKSNGPKTIAGLAVKQFAETKSTIPPEFLDKMVKNIKMFLFAGHETTSTTIATTYFLLSQNPDKLAALRAEHDAVFGSDTKAAIDAIRADYTILNKLPYTAAVVKEALRLYPPVGGSIRESSSPDFMLTHPETGAQFPTYGFMIHGSASTLGRDSTYWVDADKFIPERFLTRDETDPLYPAKNAWQPFSLGPRVCIGQEMVQLEIKLTLALTVRNFDIETAYAENAPTFFGDAAYQVALPEAVPAARIKDGLPVKVKRRVI